MTQLRPELSPESGRFLYMEHATRHLTRTFIIATSACAFALGAANAYAADNEASTEATESQVWVYQKTAVSENPAVIRVDEPLPQLILPLNTEFSVTDVQSRTLTTSADYETNPDLTEFDLVEDSPIFIGVHNDSEFESRDALRERAGYNKSLNADPMRSVAGAGLLTTF